MIELKCSDDITVRHRKEKGVFHPTLVMENYGFSEGVAPGGLRSKSDIKLLICYLLQNLGRSLSRTQINEILQDYNIANYFEINSAVSELISGGQVLSRLVDGDEELTLTGKTEQYIRFIEKDLPKTVREKAVNSAIKILERERIEKECKVEIENLEHGYHVSFSVTDMDTQLLKITIYVSDESQIEIVKRNFFNNAVGIYSDVISSLTVE